MSAKLRALAFVLLISSTAAMGGTIIGFGLEGIYNIDAVTGNTTVVYPHGSLSLVLGASPSPIPGQFFVSTGLNLWTEDLSGHVTFYGQFGVPLIAGFGLAYDADTGTLYAAGGDGGLYAVDYSDCGVGFCGMSLVAPGVGAMDFVSGAGIYYVYNDLYLYDPLTGQRTDIGPTGIPYEDRVTDLAYDADTGTFIASVVHGLPGYPPPTFGQLYRIDRNTGFATLLSPNATGPAIWGLSEIVPEPSTGVLLLSGIVALLLARRLPFLSTVRK